MRKQWSFRALAVLLVLSLLVTMGNQGLLSLGENTVTVKASGDADDGSMGDYITYNGTLDLSNVGDGQLPQEDDTQPQDASSRQAVVDKEAAKRLWSDGTIHIFNFRQLQLIGTGDSLTDGDENEATVGTGSIITDENGNAVIYSNEAKYFLEDDITLSKDEAWILPEDFSGEFVSEERDSETETEETGEDGTEPDQESTDSEKKSERLYDVESDTIYIQNIYQLKTLSDYDRANIPVMTGDWCSEKFGTGKFIFPLNDSDGYLTYSSSHNYVLSSVFTADLPEVSSPALRNAAPLRATVNPNIDHIDGRDYFGQVAVTIDSTEYILIGDRQQLDALNTGEDKIEVYGPVYKVEQSREYTTTIGGNDNSWQTDSVELIYPGDADLITGLLIDGESKDFSSNVMFDGNNGGDLSSKPYHKLDGDAGAAGLKKRTIYCTVNPDTGEYDTEQTSNPFSDLKYERSGNYIVFRDIDMGSEDWTPLMFSGSMYGVKSTGGAKLWDDEKTQMNLDTGNKPKICNIRVVPASKNDKLDVITNMGVGFFGTLSGKYDRTNTLGSTSVVRNIQLSNGSVVNPYTECYVDQTLVNGLLTVVGTVAGTVLDPVLSALLGGKDVNLREVLTSLLNARKEDPSSLATGAFAGRIVGNTVVKDCYVENIRVETAKTSFEENGKIVGKGGLVGYVQGNYKYDGLSNVLEGVGDTLSLVLNLIPGVGLGDLIDVLLSNTLPIGNLVPTGYNSPLIENCTVKGATLSNESGKLGVGGFVGTQCGAVIRNSRVINSTLKIKAARFGGGFCGVERDDIVKATLGDLGVIVGKLYPQSEIIGCSVESCGLTISGGDCLGGFIGVQANSYAIDCTIDSGSTIKMTATGDCIGGFTGKAQLGSSFGMTDYLKMDASLLSTVKGVLTGALSENNSQELLALGGVAQSEMLGCRIDCSLTLTTDGSKIGGMIGSGEAVYIGNSSDITELNKYKDGKVEIPATLNRPNTIASVKKVQAGTSFAGGAAGHLVSANTGSLLGDTLGLKSYLGFHISDVTINGVSDGYEVQADVNYAGSAIGFAIGGDAENVTANHLKSVTAYNHAGGFVGTTGPDKVVGGNGLDLNLLGLSVLKINNLLGMTSGIHTNYLDCTVNGIESGFTVQATGTRKDDDEDTTDFTAGGFAGDTTSITMTNCKVNNLRSATADVRYGMAGGFVGYSSAGSLSGVSAEKDEGSAAIDLSQLLQVEADLIPTYNNCEVTYADGGFVQANAAGGFTGDFRSGTVNTGIDQPSEDNRYAVHNIDHVLGGTYAGGFGGKVYSGALLRDGGSGLSLLGGIADVDITGLANLTQAYIPIIKYAGVDSPNGFSVMAAYIDDPEAAPAPSKAGYAGGFIGYGSGLEASYSHVNALRNGKVSVPANLEEKDGGAYMSFEPTYSAIPYAVAGARYAGGYIGYMNVGSATALGDGLKALGENLGINDVLRGLDVVVSTVEHSNVYGRPGGYSVLASSHVNLGDGKYDEAGVGYAGGFAGKMLGAHIQDSNAENFAYIIGEIAAGGYAGEMLPGDVADLLDYSSSEGGLKDLLSTVLSTDDMISLVQSFVPTIYNSRTTCIPCGGAVRAQSLSTNYIADGDILAVQRGFAGGYIGHGAAAQIWGSSNAAWAKEEEYTGSKRNCDAIRIRSVYGAEYAGGYVGLLEAGSTAKAGNLSLLGGFVQASNLLGALNVVYPTIENASVYGPLEKTELATWNAWKQYVGQYGGFASELSKIGTLSDQEQLDEVLEQFIYGYHVVAGRDEYEPGANTSMCGCAGGYAGAMYSGVIRYGTANNAKLVRAMRSAGGFAGEMMTKGLAEFGSVNLLGLGLDLGGLLKTANVLVPVVFESGVTGYQNGLIVRAEGLPAADIVTQEGNSQSVKTVNTDCGMAGGFVGVCCGGQIGNRSDGRINFKVQDPEQGAWVRNLKTVTGTNNIGGFAGKTSAASVANADDSQASNGFVQGLLDSLIGNPSQLVDALDATVTVIGKAEVTAAKPEWGIVVDGEYKDGEETKYASCAGGFVGSTEATVFGNRSIEERTLTVSNLRGVSGGCYAGGFFGLAQVGSVAEVGSSDSTTNVLGLIQAGNVSLLDVFRTYIYHATVTGVNDGITIFAYDRSSTGTMSTYQESGAAGGFGGGLMNGTVENSSVSDLNFVQSPNYSGGFIGMCGTSSGIGVDDVKAEGDESQANLLTALGLDLSTNPQLLNVVGSTVTNCSVSGFDNGFIARTTNIQAPNDDVTQADLKGSCAAGFVGFADMAHIEDSSVTGFKYAKSPQTAGGFAGRTAMNYLVDVDVNSELTGVVVGVINALVRSLYLKEAQQADVVSLDGEYAGLKLLSDGDLLYVNLLGLQIGASLCKNDPEYNQDAVIVTIGSSTIKLPCDDENGVGDSPDISITLIEGNRTDIKNCFVKGIADGYNVYGGGADDNHDGTDSLGYAGGFIGYNDAGMVSDSYTELCDVIRGTANEEEQSFMTGPFIGYTNPRSRGTSLLEDNDNRFNIYRTDNGGYTKTDDAEGTKIADAAEEKVIVNGESCNRYEAKHLGTVKTQGDLKDAVESGGSVENRELLAYVSPAMAVLMLNIPLDDNGAGDTPITSDLKDPCDEEFDLTINKVWKDFIYLGSRPESINVTVALVEFGATPPDEMITCGSTEGKTVVSTKTLTLDNSGGSVWSTTWNGVLEDQPVAVRKTTGDSETVVYYQYIVNEVEFDNYKAYYDVDQASSTAKIINRYTGPIIPATGGTGVLMFYAAGSFLLISGVMLLLLRRKPGAKKKARQLGNADVELDLSDFSDFIKYIKK